MAPAALRSASVLVILLHVSLKIFDLVFTMTGTGPGFATDMPAIFVFETMFRATRYNLASAAGITGHLTLKQRFGCHGFSFLL